MPIANRCRWKYISNFLSLVAVFLFLDIAFARTQSDPGVIPSINSTDLHGWDSFLQNQGLQTGDDHLRLPPADKIMRQLKVFLRHAHQAYEEQFHGNRTAFMWAVRHGQIFWIVGKGHKENPPEKWEGFQVQGLEVNGLADPTQARFEMTKVDQVIEVRSADGKIEKKTVDAVAVKFAPPEDFENDSDLRNRVRILFYNVDHPANKGVTIDPTTGGADIYHSRIHFNRQRHILVLNMNHGIDIDEGFYLRRPAIIQSGKFNFFDWLRGWWKAKYVRQTPEEFKGNFKLGLVSGTVQAGFSVGAFVLFANPDAAFNWLSAVMTFVYCWGLTTFGKTYSNIVDDKSLTREILKRTAIGLPLALGLAAANNADFGEISTWIKVVGINLGDKFASAVYSFIPRIRERYGLSSGKTIFGADRANAERELSAWARMIFQQSAIFNDTNPEAEYKWLGKALVWFSAIPVYKIDLNYVRKHSEKYPKMIEEFQRVKNWVNPRTHINAVRRGLDRACHFLMMQLAPPPIP